MRHTAIIALVVIILAAAGTAALSQPATDAGEMAELSGRMKELNGTLELIAASLQEQLEGQRTDQLLRRIDLQRRALQPREDALRTSRQEFDQAEAEIARLEARRELLGRPRADENAGGNPADDTQLRIAQRQADLQLEETLARRDLLEQRVLEMGGAVQGLRQDVRKWEKLLDERMGLR
jgi:hypothetical protein